jgi:hypothetical protein
VELEITPEPSEEERLAISAALAADETERKSDPSWPQALLPSRGDEPDEPAP